MNSSTVDPWTLRRRWYASGTRHRLRQPVISIGNLSVGGRGKTPVVALIARRLLQAGERPAILTRGYARRDPADGVVVVSDGEHLLADVDRAGDEPMMLARDLPGVRVVVGEQRALAGALAERSLGATVHVLDDGFQHLQLARDIDIVLVSAEDVGDRPLPFGRLREPMSALRFADAVIADGAPELQARGTLVRHLGDPVSIDPAAAWTAPDRRVVAVAGIARPDRFQASLTAAGWHVAELIGFGDHHQFTRSDVDRIVEASRRHRAPVATTGKDAVRLLKLRPLPVAIASVPLSVEIRPDETFFSWLFARLGDVRDGARART